MKKPRPPAAEQICSGSGWEVERCDAADVTAALAQAAQPEVGMLLAKPVSGATASIAWISTSKLWKLSMWHEPAAGLVQTLEAVAPDRRSWVHGCQRRWTGDGSVIEPLDGLSAEQRAALDARVLRASCWPEDGWCPMPVLEAA